MLALLKRGDSAAALPGAGAARPDIAARPGTAPGRGPALAAELKAGRA